MDFAADVEAARPGQHQVEQHQVGSALGQLGQCLRTIGGLGHLEPFALSGQAKAQADRRVVLDYQNPRWAERRWSRTAHVGASPASGRVKLKVLPRPTRLLTWT